MWPRPLHTTPRFSPYEDGIWDKDHIDSIVETYFHSITREYPWTSFEEVRWQNYRHGNFPEKTPSRTSFTQSRPTFLCPDVSRHS